MTMISTAIITSTTKFVIIISTTANSTLIVHSVADSAASSTSHLITQCPICSVASSTTITGHISTASKSTILSQVSLSSYAEQNNSNKIYANDIHDDESIVNQIHLLQLAKCLYHLTSHLVHLSKLFIADSVVKFIATTSSAVKPILVFYSLVHFDSNFTSSQLSSQL